MGSHIVWTFSGMTKHGVTVRYGLKRKLHTTELQSQSTAIDKAIELLEMSKQS